MISLLRIVLFFSIKSISFYFFVIHQFRDDNFHLLGVLIVVLGQLLISLYLSCHCCLTFFKIELSLDHQFAQGYVPKGGKKCSDEHVQRADVTQEVFESEDVEEHVGNHHNLYQDSFPSCICIFYDAIELSEKTHRNAHTSCVITAVWQKWWYVSS